jgi:hypothetical protein
MQSLTIIKITLKTQCLNPEKQLRRGMVRQHAKKFKSNTRQKNNHRLHPASHNHTTSIISTEISLPSVAQE